jgi:hypothetical protein
MKTETHISSVSSRHWGPDDDYSVIETQVFDIPNGTPVRVTITPLSKEEYMAYCKGETGVEGNPKPKVKSERKRSKK